MAWLVVHLCLLWGIWNERGNMVFMAVTPKVQSIVLSRLWRFPWV